MTEKKPGLPDEITAKNLMNRIALAMSDYPDDFADAPERLAWQAYAIIALDEIAHTDPDELRRLPSQQLSRNNRTLQ